MNTQTEVKSLSTEPCVSASANVTGSLLGRWTEVGERCIFEGVDFGDYSYAQENVNIALCEVGKFVSIAANVRINPSNHPWWRPSLHHFSYRPHKYGFAEGVDPEVFTWRAENKVRIGHDVWIGHGAIILPGVNIGNGAIVGAGSVVTKDVPPWQIVVGNPAQVLRPRFEQPDYAARLEALEWWNWPHQQIAEALPLFQQGCAEFLQAFESK